MAHATLNDTLSFHKGSQQFCKAINGRRFYLGRDEAEAYRIWRKCKADFALGIDPRREDRCDSMTLRHGANLFLAAKEARLTAGEIKPKSFREYIGTCKRFVDFFGDRSAACRCTVNRKATPSTRGHVKSRCPA